MRRTTHARLVGIGVQRPEIVDFGRVWGRAFTDAELVAAELRGEIPGWDCPDCGYRVGLRVGCSPQGAVLKHLRSERHQRATHG